MLFQRETRDVPKNNFSSNFSNYCCYKNVYGDGDLFYKNTKKESIYKFVTLLVFQIQLIKNDGKIVIFNFEDTN